MSFVPSSHLLVIPRLRVQNANAISSPLTHGFPSMTAFLGLMWALERKLNQAGLDLPLNAVGVVCHDYRELVTDGGFVKTFRLTRNPVDKKGETAAIVEEGRIHLEISLIFNVRIDANLEEWRDKYLSLVIGILSTLRVAGGTIHPPQKPWLRRYQPFVVALGSSEDAPTNFRRICRSLLPGFVLVEREDLIEKRLQELQAFDPGATRLDAWLSLSRINWRYQEQAESSKGEWQHDRIGQGWTVPIPVGYGALGDIHAPGTTANARDKTTPFRFVESLYSIGQWVAPYRLVSPEQLFWYADSQPEAGLYRCRNDFLSTTQF